MPIIPRNVIAALLLVLLCGALRAQDGAGLVLSSEFVAQPAPRPRVILPAQTLKAPEIDGDIARDLCWGRAAANELDSEMGGAMVRAEGVRTTTVRICRDADTLYVAFQCREPAISELPINPAGRDTWSEENVHLYLAPPGAEDNFFLLAIDPSGVTYDASLLEGANWTPEWQAAAVRTADGWAAEMAIPFKSLNVARANEMDIWRLNLGREVAATGERYAWEPTLGNPRDAARWGMMFFGDLDLFLRQQRPARLNLYPDRWRLDTSDSVLRIVARVDPGSQELARLRLRLEAVREGQSGGRPSTIALRGERGNIILNAAALPTGPFTLRGELIDADGLVAARAQIPLRREAGAAAPAPAGGKIDIQVPQYPTKARAAEAWPMNIGVALPQGALRSPSNVRLLDAQGNEVPCKARVRARWPADGTVRWLGLDFRANVAREGGEKYVLEYGPKVAPMPVKGFTRNYQVLRHDVAQDMYVAEGEDAWWINTGALLFSTNFKRFSGIEEATVDVDGNGTYDFNEQVLTDVTGQSGPYMVDAGGRTYRMAGDRNFRMRLEEWNELRLVLRGEGRLVAADGRGGDIGRCVFRLTAYAGQPFLRAQYTFYFSERMVRTLIQDVGVAERLEFGRRFEPVFPLSDSLEVFRQNIRETGPIALLRPQHDEVLIQNLREPATIEQRGAGAQNWAAAAATNRGLAVCLNDMNELHPKGFSFSAEGRMHLHFWPPQGSEVQRKPRQDPSRRNLGALDFAHCGRTLDLTVPPAYSRGLRDRTGMADFDAVRTMDMSDPTGLAMTYEVFYVFYKGPLDVPDIAETFRLFQMRPHAVQSAESLAASQAAGESLTAPRIERAMKVLDRLLKLDAARGAASGDFNFMDMRRSWLADEGRWSLRDHWVGGANDLGAALWRLYMQSGRPEALLAAQRYLRHMMAVDLCNEAPGHGPLHPDPRRRKIAGAFGDHRSPLHWQSTWHVASRFARVRAMLLSYYLTGDLLARDTAQVWVDAARTYGVPQAGVDGMSYLDNLSSVLLLDYDAALLERMGDCADYMFRMPLELAAGDAWAPGLREYARQSGDPRASAFLRRAAGKVPRDRFLLLGLLRDLHEIAGDAEARTQAAELLAAQEKRFDELLAAPLSRDEALAWDEFCVYILAAAGL